MISQTRQNQILEAAARCFASHGFHQTSMDMICKEAKLSPGSVYRYYRSKDDIIAAFVAQDSAETVALIALVETQPDPIKGIHDLIDTVLMALDAPLYSQLSVEIAAEAAHNPRIAALVRQSDTLNTAALSTALERAKNQGTINQDLDIRQSAELIIALIDGLTWRKSLDPDASMARYGRSIKRMLSGLLEASEPE